ncbi:hypothetical protein HYFRA_00010506 [Hymenoscyphus fraxineus]|uniref:2EXR domain-containing protein n=1 Tax=Hymenoscyphus fraxineus TaxID=746836 RepID=A0A9N9L209_9HELO|nr:hypothetical protein HYFRA_00010506 [Hymenoscyphus fraxineus]
MESSTPSVEKSPRTFTLFPTLPTELRLKIWHFILPGPRDVIIKYALSRSQSSRIPLTTWKSPTPIPKILHINREAREVGLKYLTPALPHIYMNLALDTFVLGNGTDANRVDYPLLDILLGGDYQGSEVVDKIQRLKMDEREEDYGRSYFVFDEVRQFGGLRFVTIFLDDEEDGDVGLSFGIMRERLEGVTRRYPEWRVPRFEVRRRGGCEVGVLGGDNTGEGE